jgi:hypothetical protein
MKHSRLTLFQLCYFLYIVSFRIVVLRFSISVFVGLEPRVMLGWLVASQSSEGRVAVGQVCLLGEVSDLGFETSYLQSDVLVMIQ